MSFKPNCKMIAIYPPVPYYHQFIEVTLVLPCKNKCEYCPQELIPSKYFGKMNRDQFDILLRNLRGSCVRRIDFSGMSEPFQHPDCAVYIADAMAAGFEVICYTTGNGMTQEKFDYLKQHIPNKYIEFHLTLINPKHPQRQGMTYEESEAARDLFRKNVRPPWQYCELRIGDDDIWGNSISRAGNLDAAPISVPAEIPIACKKPWANVIMPNGDVITCCQDYKAENVFGNIFEQTYEEIRNGEAMRDFVMKMSGVKRDANLICRRCEHLYGTQQQFERRSNGN